MSHGMHMSMSQNSEESEAYGGDIPRRETGLRILMTILFLMIGSVVEAVVAVIVLFELLFALVTQRAPGLRVREFANRIISYYYKVGRYLTYNESRLPFPFSDFPDALEGDSFDPSEAESTALGLRPSQAVMRDEEESY